MAQNFNVEAARQEGYSDDEIIQHLTTTRKFDVGAARKEGYSSQEIIQHLSGAAPTQSAPAQPTPQFPGFGPGYTKPASSDFVPGGGGSRRGGGATGAWEKPLFPPPDSRFARKLDAKAGEMLEGTAKAITGLVVHKDPELLKYGIEKIVEKNPLEKAEAWAKFGGGILSSTASGIITAPKTLFDMGAYALEGDWDAAGDELLRFGFENAPALLAGKGLVEGGVAKGSQMKTKYAARALEKEYQNLSSAIQGDTAMGAGLDNAKILRPYLQSFAKRSGVDMSQVLPEGGSAFEMVQGGTDASLAQLNRALRRQWVESGHEAAKFVPHQNVHSALLEGAANEAHAPIANAVRASKGTIINGTKMGRNGKLMDVQGNVIRQLEAKRDALSPSQQSQYASTFNDAIADVRRRGGTVGGMDEIRRDWNTAMSKFYGGKPGAIADADALTAAVYRDGGNIIRQELYPVLEDMTQRASGTPSLIDSGRREAAVLGAKDGVFVNRIRAANMGDNLAIQGYIDYITEGPGIATRMARNPLATSATMGSRLLGRQLPMGKFNAMLRKGIGDLSDFRLMDARALNRNPDLAFENPLVKGESSVLPTDLPNVTRKSTDPIAPSAPHDQFGTGLSTSSRTAGGKLPHEIAAEEAAAEAKLSGVQVPSSAPHTAIPPQIGAAPVYEMTPAEIAAAEEAARRAGIQPSAPPNAIGEGLNTTGVTTGGKLPHEIAAEEAAAAEAARNPVRASESVSPIGTELPKPPTETTVRPDLQRYQESPAQLNVSKRPLESGDDVDLDLEDGGGAPEPTPPPKSGAPAASAKPKKTGTPTPKPTPPKAEGKVETPKVEAKPAEPATVAAKPKKEAKPKATPKPKAAKPTPPPKTAEATTVTGEQSIGRAYSDMNREMGNLTRRIAENEPGSPMVVAMQKERMRLLQEMKDSIGDTSPTTPEQLENLFPATPVKAVEEVVPAAPAAPVRETLESKQAAMKAKASEPQPAAAPAKPSKKKAAPEPTAPPLMREALTPAEAKAADYAGQVAEAREAGFALLRENGVLSERDLYNLTTDPVVQNIFEMVDEGSLKPLVQVSPEELTQLYLNHMEDMPPDIAAIRRKTVPKAAAPTPEIKTAPKPTAPPKPKDEVEAVKAKENLAAIDASGLSAGIQDFFKRLVNKIEEKPAPKAEVEAAKPTAERQRVFDEDVERRKAAKKAKEDEEFKKDKAQYEEERMTEMDDDIPDPDEVVLTGKQRLDENGEITIDDIDELIEQGDPIADQVKDWMDEVEDRGREVDDEMVTKKYTTFLKAVEKAEKKGLVKKPTAPPKTPAAAKKEVLEESGYGAELRAKAAEPAAPSGMEIKNGPRGGLDVTIDGQMYRVALEPSGAYTSGGRGLGKDIESALRELQKIHEQKMKRK